MARKKRPQAPPDDPEYVQQWARDLVGAVGKCEARRLMEDYQALADDKKLAKRDRAIAAQRAEILPGLL